MGPEQQTAQPDRLGLRLISAAVLAPVVVAAAIMGGIVFELLVIGAGVILAWEWSGLSAASGGRGAFLPLAGVAVVVGALAARGHAGLALLALGVTSAALWAFLHLMRDSRPMWIGLGAWVIGLPILCLIWIRDASAGLGAVLVLFFVVWATDIAAYAVGRLVGGPKLAPDVSPKKTWSGAIGGFLAALVVGYGVSLGTGGTGGWPVLVLSAILGLLAIGGDLLESGLKRHFHLKDTGTLIPGHGGLMDRIDSLLAATLVLAGFHLLTPGGIGAWL